MNRAGGDRVPALGRRHSLRVPFRIALALAVLALPLGGAMWAVGNFAATNERERADSRLAASLQTAGAAYVRAGDELERRAGALALRRAVQRAFVRRDRRALERLQSRTPKARFTLGEAEAAFRRPALTGTARVVAGRRVAGRVTVFTPLDAAFAERLHREAGIRADVLLAFSDPHGRVLAPSRLDGRVGTARARSVDVRLGGERYRAVSTRLPDDEARLVALVAHASIASAERDARTVVLLAGLGTLLGVIITAYLVSPAIARARVAKQEREEAARVLEQVADGICAVDRDGVIRLWNPAAEAITGLAASKVRGRAAASAVPGWGKLEELVPASDSPGERRSAVTVPVEVGGRELWLSVSAVRSEEGTVYAFRDLTAERRFEEMRSDLVATVSHELRTPLASIQGAAVTLRKREPELDRETRNDLLAIVAEQSNRLARLADEILLTSQLGLGSADVREERVDPVAVASDVIEAARAQAGARIVVTLELRGEVPAVVADADRLRQVFANVVDNAIKYSPDGGRVDVRLVRTDGRVRFSVHDEGIGIPPSEHGRIFEKFYRLDPQLSRGVGGGGLGLYISRELLRHMRGRIWVESEPGRGSTFFVELPVADAVAPASAA